MEIKTVSKAGANTIKTQMERATKQGAKVVIFRQNTRDMTRRYVEAQIKLFCDKSPLKAREALEYVVVVSKDGKRVHRHKLK